MNYNLLEEPWIPVLMRDGECRRVGIKDALTQAHRIRQIAASNPMDRLSILRFLLAILYWCKGNPPRQSKAKRDASFPSSWFKKLDANKDYFNLLGKGKRFYQYKTSFDKPLTANYLIHEVPTGKNAWHFRHSTDKVEGLCLACCAMGLLRLPVFSTSGGGGKPPGINRKPPFYVVPMGASLAETLRLSWRPVPTLGMPAWEKPSLPLPKTGEVPLLTGLTWLPRRVWLSNPEKRESTCISCGCTERLIRLSIFGPIGSTRTDDSGPGRIWRDPHVLFTTTSTGENISLQVGDALGSPNAAAGQWARVIAGILESDTISTSPTSMWIVGFSTIQNNKYLEIIEHTVSFPTPPKDIQKTIEKIRRWQRTGSSLARWAEPREDTDSPRRHLEIPPMLAAIRPHAESRVFSKVGQLVADEGTAWRQATDEYRPAMGAISRLLSPGFTATALEKRRRIAAALPHVRPKPTKDDEKPSEENGEGN